MVCCFCRPQGPRSSFFPPQMIGWVILSSRSRAHCFSPTANRNARMKMKGQSCLFLLLGHDCRTVRWHFWVGQKRQAKNPTTKASYYDSFLFLFRLTVSRRPGTSIRSCHCGCLADHELLWPTETIIHTTPFIIHYHYHPFHFCL